MRSGFLSSCWGKQVAVWKEHRAFGHPPGSGDWREIHHLSSDSPAVGSEPDLVAKVEYQERVAGYDAVLIVLELVRSRARPPALLRWRPPRS
jgi:hypothetical protein